MKENSHAFKKGEGWNDPGRVIDDESDAEDKLETIHPEPGVMDTMPGIDPFLVFVSRS